MLPEHFDNLIIGLYPEVSFKKNPIPLHLSEAIVSGLPKKASGDEINRNKINSLIFLFLVFGDPLNYYNELVVLETQAEKQSPCNMYSSLNVVHHF